jgi:hypothetical protein
MCVDASISSAYIYSELSIPLNKLFYHYIIIFLISFTAFDLH